MKTVRLILPVMLPLLLASCSSTVSNHAPTPEQAAQSAGAAHLLARGGKAWPGPEKAKERRPRGLIWRAAGTPRGVILCLHGVQTHAAWFGPLAQELNARGWTVIAPDRRGSGVNAGPPFVRGHTTGPAQLLADLASHMQEARREAGGRPLILLGTSWGSNLATAYVSAGDGPQPTGLVQLVPATKMQPQFLPGFGQRLLLGAANIFKPAHQVKLPFGPEHYLAGKDQETGAGELPGQQSANAELRVVLERDARQALLKKPTVRTLITGNKLTKQWTRQAPPAQVLVITADGDQLMDNEAARAAFKNTTTATSARIPGGHGAQITHAAEIASKIAAWIKTINK